jgi:hypothetical protein
MAGLLRLDPILKGWNLANHSANVRLQSRRGGGLNTSSTPDHACIARDGLIGRRLRATPRKQERRPSMGRSAAFFADQGCLPWKKRVKSQNIPTEETNDWRAMCG